MLQRGFVDHIVHTGRQDQPEILRANVNIDWRLEAPGNSRRDDRKARYSPPEL